MFEEIHYILYINDEEIKFKFYTIRHVKRWLLKHLEYLGQDMYIIEHRRKLDPPEWVDKKKCISK